MRTTRWWINRTLVVAVLLLAGVTRVPEALAFPYRATVGTTQVWSERPITAALPGVLARADRLVAASPLAGGDASRRLFLTDGGWRWRLLALTEPGSYGLRRPWSAALILNRSDLARDRVGRDGGRSLSGTIAHETSHLLVARRIGELAALRLPTWVSEGLADHVASESRLSDAQAASMRKTNPGHRALAYYDARRRVAAALASPGGSVDRLLAHGR